MAAHRYWRVDGIATYAGGGLSISEFQLFSASSRADAGATLTSNMAPASGALADLSDGAAAGVVVWGSAAAEALVLSWDFGGSPQDITDIRLGAADDIKQFPVIVRLSYSDDAWVTSTLSFVFSGIAWPGRRTLTSSRLVGQLSLTEKLPGVFVSRDRRRASINSSGNARGETFRSSGVYQFEVVPDRAMGVSVGEATASRQRAFDSANGWSYNGTSPGYKHNNGSLSAYGTPFGAGDVIGAVVNFTTGTLTYYKNGVSQGVAYTTMSGKTLVPILDDTVGGAPTVPGPLLRTSNFAYPVAGALPWALENDRIFQNAGEGRTVYTPPLAVASAASVPIAYGQTVITPVFLGRKDFLTGVLGEGVGRVKGTTKDKGTPNVPVSERVRLHRQRDGLVLREVWSTPGTGAYSFDYVDEFETYYVVTFDHDGLYRAVVADGLTLANGGVELIA